MLKELKARMKVIKTCNVYFCFLILGMTGSLTGPCLLDLQHMVYTDIKSIAMIYTTGSAGFLIGAIIGGVLLDLVRSKQAVLTVSILFVTITLFGIPWCRNIYILLALTTIKEFFLGAIETGSNVICLQLWGKDGNPIFQGSQLAFSLGGLLSPLIVAPFLENIKELSFDMDNNMNTEKVSMNLTAIFSNKCTLSSVAIPKIIYPFSIVGAVALFVTVLHLGVCIISPTEDECPKYTAKIDNSKKGFLFVISTAICIFFIFFIVAGSEIGYGQTLTIFSVKSKLQLTTTQGTYITSAFWAAFTIGRLISVFLSIKISCLKLVIVDLCLAAAAVLILLLLMPNEWALWLASVIYGAGIASVFAALVGWINSYIDVTNKISAILTAGCGAGLMIIPFGITYFIDTIPEIFSFVTAASVLLTAVLVLILYYIFQKGSEINKAKV